MNKMVFAIFDEKAQAFLQPFFFETIGLATRALSDCLNDPQHNFALHPADYTLFQLGSFDQLTGELIAEKQVITTLIELKAKEVIE